MDQLISAMHGKVLLMLVEERSQRRKQAHAATSPRLARKLGRLLLWLGSALEPQVDYTRDICSHFTSNDDAVTVTV